MTTSSLGGGLPKEETNHNDDEDVEALPHRAKARNNESFGRSLDEFLQAAISLPHPHGSHDSNSNDNSDNDNSMSHIKRMLQCLQVQWRYWLVFVCLGVANSSDAAEILCLSYMLSNRSFQRQILLSSSSSDSDSDTESSSSSSWRAGMLAATVFCGMLLGGLLVGGSWGDAAGRRPVLLAGLATNAVAGLASAVVAWNVASLSCIRFVAGIGIGASIPPLFALCSELAAPAQRGLCVTIAASFWMVGSIYVAVTAWWWFGGSSGSDTNQEDDEDRGWRVFAAACALPSAAGFWLVHRYVPESPRFLLTTTTTTATSTEQQQQQRSYQEEKAVSIVQDLANRAGYRGPPWTLEEARRHHQQQSQAPSLPLDDAPLLMVGDNTYTSLTSTNSPTHHHHHHSGAAAAAVAGWCRRLVLLLRQTWHDFYVSAAKLYVPEGQLRQITWPLQMVWFSLSFGTYGLYTWINTLFFAVHMQNVYQNALLFAAANLPGNILSAVLMDRIGRATLLTSSVLAAALSLVSFAYIAFYDDDDDEKNNNNTNNNNDTNNDPPISTSWIVVSACAFQCFTIVAWNAIDVLTSELFPTTVRSTGMGICAASGRIGAMLAQFINGILVARPVALLLVAAVTLLVGAVTPVLLPSDQTGQPVRDDIVVVMVVPEQQRESSFSKTVVVGSGGSGAMEEGESLQELMDRRRHHHHHHHHHHPQMEGTDVVAAGHRQQLREEDLTYRALSSSAAANHDNQAYQSSAAQQQ